MRAPFQVLVFPYMILHNEIKFAVFKRKDMGYWQGIAGGGEHGESPVNAAKREALEEAAIPTDSTFKQLESISSIPVEHVVGSFLWGEDVFVIPEYSFGVAVESINVSISDEHLAYKWVNYHEAITLLKWDSNKTALWELNQRLIKEKGVTLCN